MLSKQHRLSSRKAFRNLSVLTTPFYTVKYERNDEDVPSQFAFVVSKKVDVRATSRNRLKRVVRSTVEQRIQQVRPGFSVLFIMRKRALSVSGEELRASVSQTMTKIGLI